MQKPEFIERYGPTALVTGAALGIGRGFAQCLAERGMALLLVDIEADALEQTANEIRSRYQIDVATLVADLTDAKALDRVAAAGLQAETGLLVNNAGFGHTTAFLDTPLEDHLKVLDLNTRAPLVLTHKLLPALQSRGRGGVIFTSSISAVIGVPGIGNYAATKAYTYSLAEALYGEMHAKGVDVLALLPGLTRTRAVTASLTEEEARKLTAMEPEQVAEGALKALGKSPSVVPGLRPRLGRFLMRFIPHKPFLKARGKVQYEVG